ncbi:hypothetical protein MTR67_027219, partial [Solanum verrucosum]
RPLEGILKLNIDGSYEPKTNSGGTGGVIRHHQGCWIMGFACKVRAQNVLHAQLVALLHGLNLAKEKKQLLVETDSQVLFNSFKGKYLIYSYIYADCRSLIQQMEEASLQHIRREANSVVDLLADYERTTKDPNMTINQL